MRGCRPISGTRCGGVLPRTFPDRPCRLQRRTWTRSVPCCSFHHFALVMDKAHTFTTATHRRLQHHGITYLVADAHGFFGTLQRLFRSGNTGTPAAIIRLRAAILSPIASIVSAAGPIKIILPPCNGVQTPSSPTKSRNPDGWHRHRIALPWQSLFQYSDNSLLPRPVLSDKPHRHMPHDERCGRLGEDRNRKQSHLPARTHDAQAISPLLAINTFLIILLFL